MTAPPRRTDDDPADDDSRDDLPAAPAVAPRYQVHKHVHEGGGLFELEITIRWDVVDLRTGEIVRTFRDESSAHYDGVGWSGGASGSLVDVTVDVDQRAVLLHHAGGRVERVPLA